MPSIHHTFGPSGSAIHLECAGSIVLGQGVPNVSGDAAKEGTACHQLLEYYLGIGVKPEAFLGKAVTGDVSSKGEPFLVTEEMCKAVYLFEEVLEEVCGRFGIDRMKGRAEQYFVSKVIPDELFGGTCDWYVVDNGVLVVADLKFGRRPVQASSPQLSEYACLVIESLPESERQAITKVIQVVVQPRLPLEKPYDICEMPLARLQEIWAKLFQQVELFRQYKDAQDVPDELFSTGKHCEYCRVQNQCPALRLDLEKAVTAAENPESPEASTVESIQYWLEKEAAIYSFLKNNQKRALAMAKEGVQFPGKKLVPSFGNRSWTKIVADKTLQEQVRYLTRRIGIPAKEVKTSKILSPTQMQKWMQENGVWKDEKKQKVLEELVERVPRGFRLVNESHKGPEVTPSMIDSLESQLEAYYDD
jgi:hypothetical protein